MIMFIHYVKTLSCVNLWQINDVTNHTKKVQYIQMAYMCGIKASAHSW